MRVEKIGNQTLYLGDCLEIMPTLDKVDAVVTDPPYGMAYVSSRRKQKYRPIENDTETDLLSWICEYPAYHSKYIFHRWNNIVDIPKPKSLIVWCKNNWSSGDLNGEHARSTEFISFYPGENHKFPTGRPSDVIRTDKSLNEYHPTQKPIQLMKKIIGWTSGIVIDPFMGSGTTLVACQQMGRHGIGIEIDPQYFQIACERVHNAWMQPDLFNETKPTHPTNTGD